MDFAYQPAGWLRSVLQRKNAKATGEGNKNKEFQTLDGKEPELKRVNLCNHSLRQERVIYRQGIISILESA